MNETMISKGRGRSIGSLVEPSDVLASNEESAATFSTGCKSLGRGSRTSLHKNLIAETSTMNELGNVKDNVDELSSSGGEEQDDTMNEWYYKDPNGFPRGPFSHTVMREWYKHGYFMDPKLLIKRACQTEFYPLKELVIQSTFTGDVTPFVYIPPTKKKMNFSDKYKIKEKNEVIVNKPTKKGIESKEETQCHSESKDSRVTDDDSKDAVKQLLEKVTQLENQITKLSTAPKQITISDLKDLVRDESTSPPASHSSPKREGVIPDRTRGLLTRISAAEEYAKEKVVVLPGFTCEINGVCVEAAFNFDLKINLISQAIVDDADLSSSRIRKFLTLPPVLGIKPSISFQHQAFFDAYFSSTRFDDLSAGVARAWSSKSTQQLWFGSYFMDEYDVKWTPDCEYILLDHPKRHGIYIHGHPVYCRRDNH